MKNSPDTPLKFSCGATMKNRFMLAPLTNTQSYANGQLSNEELEWLKYRAKGQFAIVMTCASHVRKDGQGFPGQLGIFSDDLIEGHQKLTAAIHQEGSLALIQLHHAGMRSPENLIGEKPISSSADDKTGARALSLKETEDLRDSFIAAAIRAKKSNYDGVEIHGAHGYILSQYLSATINKRNDIYGGSLKNRARIIFEIIDGIRNACGKDFLVALRLSPERYGMDIDEVKKVCQQIIAENKVDFLDISLWDCFKYPEEEKYQNKTLLQHFTDIDFKQTKLTVAGKIRSANDVQTILNHGVDFVSIGQSGILHHDFPQKVINDPSFTPTPLPVSATYLLQEKLSPKFINYLKKWPNFLK